MFLLIITLASAEQDSDLDGIPDSKDRFPYDYDNDGMADLWEKNNNLNPELNDADEDPDSDGITNLEEFRHGTTPNDHKVEAPAPEKSNRLVIGGSIGLFVLLSVVVLYDFGIHKKGRDKPQRAYPQYRNNYPQQANIPPRQSNQTYYDPLSNQQNFRRLP